MLKQVIFILIFFNIILLFGCESEIDNVKKENLFLRKQIGELKLENNKLNEQIIYIKNVYNIDVSNINSNQKQSSGIIEKVFGGN